MSNGKPKGPTPSLIGSTLGRPKRELTAGPSKCKRCKAHIAKGVNCVAIPHLQDGFGKTRRYCDGCFRAILERSQQVLNELASL